MKEQTAVEAEKSLLNKKNPADNRYGMPDHLYHERINIFVSTDTSLQRNTSITDGRPLGLKRKPPPTPYSCMAWTAHEEEMKKNVFL